MIKSILVFNFFVVLIFLTVSSCEKESFTTDPADKLSFSLDTLTFDTVFTEIGSVTKSFKVINRHDESIRISEISLAKQNDFFHINIDGVPTDKSTEVELLPNDSIYIFVEVTIDPNMPLSASPYVIEEDILFSTNGNNQKVHLTAWGQNAVYLPRKNGRGVDYGLVCEMDGTIEWNDPRPYVIYGRLFIDSCELILPPACKVYVHGGIALTRQDDGALVRYNDGAIVVYNKGKLTINGTVEDPVIIQGDRLDEDYQEVFGQWVGFYFLNQTRHNTIKNAIIKNAIRAIYVDSASDVSIQSSIIHNTIGAGIEARHARVNVRNTLIYNNLSNAVNITYGGTYSFDNCTFVSDDNNSSALYALNFTCSDFSRCSEDIRFNPLNLVLNNNIIVGDQDDELIVVDGTDGSAPGMMSYHVNNCLITSTDILDSPEIENFSDCINYKDDDILFLDKANFDFHLDTFSVAEQKAKSLFNIAIDLDGITRDQTIPDIGCYEFVE